LVVPFEIIPPGTKIDFIGKRGLCAALSIGLLLASLVAVGVRGIHLGIDFAGGSEVQVQFAPGSAVDEGQIRAVLADHEDIRDPSVVRFGAVAEKEFLIRFAGNALEVDSAAAEEGANDATDDETGDEPIAQAEQAEEAAGTPDRVEAMTTYLQASLGELTVQRVEFVGPRVGAELQEDGLLSLLWASLAILAYVAQLVSSRFAPGAVVAVIHDLGITAGIYVILGMEFDLRVLAALLAILGYSLNDTIIIYDRIRENLELRTKRDLPEVLNQSVNQTLSRTVLTSGTTIMALLSLYFLGGEVIRPFAFAMLIGVIVGTYSSIYIASPILLLLEEWMGAPSAKAK
jgi:preprotein translocase subunit SecF